MRLAIVTLLLLATAPAAALAQAPAALTAAARRGEIAFGKSTTIDGSLTSAGQPLPGQQVTLEANPYPFAGWTQVGATLTAPDGNYSFGVAPNRNTRYRVRSSGQTARTKVVVDELLTAKVKALPLGRMRVTVTSTHPRDLAWGGRRAYWFVAEGSRRRFARAARTRTHQRRGVTRVMAEFPVAAGHFRFLVCFAAPTERALGPPASHSRCRHAGVRAAPHARARKTVTHFLGGGFAPFGYPFARRAASAARYLRHRSGRTAFAIVDSEGRLSGVNVHRTFVSASVVKAMLLVAYLRKLDRHHRPLDSGSRSILYPMIHVSDNSAATAVWSRVGDPALYRLAHAAG
ncbi:MAG: Beta-lactamase enzyme family, partial [Thermoleophilaceae bacterium]|nr:Beta-lactamase enzyme family [Thermoleophilaceae bacterium]